MTVRQRILLWICLPLLTLSLAIGYASIAEELSISGTASYEPKEYEGVYIHNVELVSVSNASNVEFSYVLPTNLQSSVQANAQNASVTYKVTVHNNTDITYWYIQQDVVSSHAQNSLLGQSNGITVLTKDKESDYASTFNQEDWIPPQTMRDFYVTYRFGSNAQGKTETLINFRFGLKMDAVYDQFLAVLNDQSANGGYALLSSAFDAQFKENGSTVIGNVGEDAALFNSLFGQMTVNINGVETPVTVMVRRENVDGRTTGDSYNATNGPTGCEYTVYITTDPLTSPTGTASVYAISYSRSADGTWHRLGELYEGAAPVTDYDKTDSTYQGAFDVYSWVAAPNEYETADGIKYKVGQEQGDQYDKMNTLEDLMSVGDQDIFNDIDNARIFKKAFDILAANPNYDDPSILKLYEAFTNASPYYTIYNNGAEIKVNRNCTRAEIIPYLVDLQQALDYYYQVEHS